MKNKISTKEIKEFFEKCKTQVFSMKDKISTKEIKEFIEKHKAQVSFVTSMVFIVCIAIGLTIAYLSDTSDIVVNNFETPEIETSIEESFDGVTKENITATNSIDSDVDVYVRLKFVVQTLEAELDQYGNPIMQDESGNDVYVIYDTDGTIIGYSSEDDGEADTGLTYGTLTYKTGSIVATPNSFDDNGYLLNLPITIINVLDVEGLNVDFSGNGDADWFTDANEETGIYFYKYSLAPGESAYDLVSKTFQEVFYEDVIVRLTVLVDSVQVDGVEDAWENVSQSDDYTDANGNPILYSSTYTEEDGGTGIPPEYNRVAAETNGSLPTGIENPAITEVNYLQRFSSNYEDTQGINSYGEDLITGEVTTSGS